MVSRRPWSFFVLASLFVAASAAAQPVAQVYPAKFVCGFQVGNVPLLSTENPFPHRYEALKPGNYATLINYLNVDFSVESQSFVPFVVIEGVGPITITSFTLTPLQTVQIDCIDVMNALGPFLPTPPVGEVFEGYVLTITSANDPLQVDVVYTYESKDAFKEHIVWGLTEDGVLQDRALALLQGGFKLGPFPGISDFRAIAIAGSGAGGLGLGASIDVERVTPRDIITTPGVRNPFAQFMPK